MYIHINNKNIQIQQKMRIFVFSKKTNETTIDFYSYYNKCYIMCYNTIYITFFFKKNNSCIHINALFNISYKQTHKQTNKQHTFHKFDGFLFFVLIM